MQFKVITFLANLGKKNLRLINSLSCKVSMLTVYGIQIAYTVVQNKMIKYIGNKQSYEQQYWGSHFTNH